MDAKNNPPRGRGRPRSKLVLADMIEHWFDTDQFKQVVVYGPSGLGKSVYAWETLREVYPELAVLDKEKDKQPIPEFLWTEDGPFYNTDLRQFLLFRPEELVGFATYARKHKKRYPVVLLDDAGLWFGSERRFDPFVQASVEFLQVARTCLSAIIITTPRLKNLLTNIRSSDCLTTRIVKNGRYRRACGYTQTVDVRGRLRVRPSWDDSFSPMLPNDLYEWYQKVRSGYVDLAAEKMRNALELQSNMEQWRRNKYARKETV